MECGKYSGRSAAVISAKGAEGSTIWRASHVECGKYSGRRAAVISDKWSRLARHLVGGILDKGSTGLDRWRASHGVVDTLKYRHCAARHEVGEVGTGRRECITPRLKSRASRTWSVGP